MVVEDVEIASVPSDPARAKPTRAADRVLLLVVLAGLVFRLAAMFLNKQDRSAAVFSAAAILTGLGAATFRFYPMCAERVSLWLAPVALVCLAKGVQTLARLRPNVLFKPVAVGLMIALTLWTAATVYVQGHELWRVEEMRTVLERLVQSERDLPPILVSKSASYAFRLYFTPRGRTKVVWLPQWIISFDQVSQGWLQAGRPERFWLVLTGRDFNHISKVSPPLLKFCAVRKEITEGVSGAFLLHLRSPLAK